MEFTNDLCSLPIVVGTDHALSIGWQVRLCTTGELVKPEFRASEQAVEQFKTHYPGCKGLHATWSRHKEVVLYIDTEEEDETITNSRLVELIVHEVSHCVDYMFRRANIEQVDTELRAYMNDWIVGKVIRHFRGFE